MELVVVAVGCECACVGKLHSRDTDAAKTAAVAEDDYLDAAAAGCCLVTTGEELPSLLCAPPVLPSAPPWTGRWEAGSLAPWQWKANASNNGGLTVSDPRQHSVAVL